MLPPDVPFTVMPWRILVPLLQLNGGFPYRIPSTSNPPVFSLPLCLWSVAIHLFMMAMFTLSHGEERTVRCISDIGTATYIYSTIAMMVTLMLGGFILLIKSNAIAGLIHDLIQMKHVLPPLPRHWWCNGKTLPMLVFVFSLTGSSVLFVILTMKSSKVMEFLFFMTGAVLGPNNFWLPIELFYSSISVLAHYLLVSTKATAAKVSVFFASNEFSECKSDMKVTMAALQHLDAVILEVEVKRERITRLFFPIITLFLVIGIMLAISSPYLILQGSFMEGTTIGTLFFSFYMIGRLSHTGQTFISKVGEAEGVLKELRGKSPDLNVSLKVNLVMESLSSLLTFDVCGWYTLSYSSFLAIFNTIMTYIVIIFQMGGAAVNRN